MRCSYERSSFYYNVSYNIPYDIPYDIPFVFVCFSKMYSKVTFTKVIEIVSFIILISFSRLPSSHRGVCLHLPHLPFHLFPFAILSVRQMPRAARQFHTHTGFAVCRLVWPSYLETIRNILIISVTERLLNISEWLLSSY